MCSQWWWLWLALGKWISIFVLHNLFLQVVFCVSWLSHVCLLFHFLTLTSKNFAFQTLKFCLELCVYGTGVHRLHIFIFFTVVRKTFEQLLHVSSSLYWSCYPGFYTLRHFIRGFPSLCFIFSANAQCPAWKQITYKWNQKAARSAPNQLFGKHCTAIVAPRPHL